MGSVFAGYFINTLVSKSLLSRAVSLFSFVVGALRLEVCMVWRGQLISLSHECTRASHRGIFPGDKDLVGLLSSNGSEWICSDLLPGGIVG